MPLKSLYILFLISLKPTANYKNIRGTQNNINPEILIFKFKQITPIHTFYLPKFCFRKLNMLTKHIHHCYDALKVGRIIRISLYLLEKIIQWTISINHQFIESVFYIINKIKFNSRKDNLIHDSLV